MHMLPICRLFKMIALQSLTRYAGAPFAQGSLRLLKANATPPFAGGRLITQVRVYDKSPPFAQGGLLLGLRRFAIPSLKKSLYFMGYFTNISRRFILFLYKNLYLFIIPFMYNIVIWGSLEFLYKNKRESDEKMLFSDLTYVRGVDVSAA